MTINDALIQEITLNQNATTVTFSNIPQTGYTDLKILISARGTASAIYESFQVNLNGSTANWTERGLYGLNGSAGSESNANPAFVVGANATANTFSNIEIYIPNYTSSNYKSLSIDTVTESNAANGPLIYMAAGLQSSVSPVSSISFAFNSANSFVAGSTFTLYGITALGTTPTQTPKAAGGDIIKNDGTYWYHAFLSTGAFIPQTAISADILVVAGGGGGGGNGGGGGAGGLLGFTSQSLTATSYTCTVGAGGAGGNTSAQALQGSNSIFGALTAAIGGGDGNTQSSPWTYGTGGSGGGGGSGVSAGRAGTSGQGNAGGNATVSSPYPNGGGGGAGAAGGNGSGSTAGNGGNGATYNTTVGGTAGPYAFINPMGSATGTGQLSGGNYYYAGGGGGCVNSGTAGTGGLGGGANGTGNFSGGQAPSGTVNTGGGGGGGGGTGSTPSTIGGNGGSGIIIIRYAMA